MRVHFKRANGAKVTLDDVDVVAHTVRETRERLATAMASMGTGGTAAAAAAAAARRRG